jgi:hypothetical protein
MKHIHLFLSFVLIFSTNLLIARGPVPTFGNTGVITICVNGSYYLNPSTTVGTFSTLSSTIATVNASGYVTGVSAGTTTVSLVATGGGTVTASVTVAENANPSLSITDPLAEASYKFNNNPQGPVGGTINYVAYNGFNYSSQTRPINSGFYKASLQSGNEAGCPYTFYIFRCTTCETVSENTTHYVGEPYGGGIVFYVTDGGAHGLIAATTDLGTGIRWYNGSYSITGAAGTAIGTGFANTRSIINSQGGTATSYAAGLARAYNGGGYTDWYLPSIDELGELYINKATIGGFTTVFETGRYWSSTEELETNLDAKYKDFFDGLVEKNTKTFQYRVRAIRSF